MLHINFCPAPSLRLTKTSTLTILQLFKNLAGLFFHPLEQGVSVCNPDLANTPGLIWISLIG